MRVLFLYPARNDLFGQLMDGVTQVLFATRGGAAQTVARAKNRPESGVTVIDVPKTAETCSEVMT